MFDNDELPLSTVNVSMSAVVVYAVGWFTTYTLSGSAVSNAEMLCRCIW